MKKIVFLISLMVVAVMSVNAKAAKADAARRAYYEAYISYDMSRVPNWKFPKYIMLGESINLPYTIDNYGDDMNNVTVSLMVNGEEADKNQIASIITDEDMGEGTYAGQFTYTPTAVGNLEIQLVLTFDGDEEDEGGEHESELLTISVVNETPEPDAIANIADLKSYEGGDVLLTLTDAFDYDTFSMVTTDVVVFEDATAGICLQGSGLGSLVTAGQILNGKLAMTTATGFGSVSAKLTNGINGVEVTNGELTPLVLTSDNVNSFLANCEWRLITLPEATSRRFLTRMAVNIPSTARSLANTVFRMPSMSALLCPKKTIASAPQDISTLRLQDWSLPSSPSTSPTWLPLSAVFVAKRTAQLPISLMVLAPPTPARVSTSCMAARC